MHDGDNGQQLAQMTEKHSERPNGEERFPLDDAAIQTLQEIRDSVKAAQAGAQMAQQAVIAYFCRQHNLQGQVGIAENGRELIVRKVQQGVNQ